MEITSEELSQLEENLNRARKIGWLTVISMIIGGGISLIISNSILITAIIILVLGSFFVYYYNSQLNKEKFHKVKTSAEAKANQTEYGEAILSHVVDNAFSNNGYKERFKYYEKVLIVATFEENINAMMSIFQENTDIISDDEQESTNKIQRLYSEIQPDADPDVIIEQIKKAYELGGEVYSTLLKNTISTLEDDNWSQVESRLEMIEDFESNDVYNISNGRWDPRADYLNDEESITHYRDQLIRDIGKLDNTAPEDREFRFRYAARLANLKRVQNDLNNIRDIVEDDKFLRARDEIRECQDDINKLLEAVDDDGFDNLQSQISATEDSLLELEREVQDKMTGTSQPETTTTNETVDWTPDTGMEESAELPDHEVIEEIGSGGNADVRKVELTDTGEVAALKIPRWQGTVSGDIISGFAEEAETWESIDNHDHIVSVYDSGTNPYPWMLLEYMAEGSLRDRLDNGTTIENPSEILVNVCEAVSHAHRYGIAHNDLKPANFLFDAEDNIKVADWGLAKILLDHSTSVEGLTPQYAAPEQVDPDNYGGTDDTTDVYQLGVIAYELLTGEPPYGRSNPAGTVNAILEADPVPPSERNPDLPTAVDDVILQAMAPEKEDRYEHILYLRDELSELPFENIEKEL